MEASKADVSGAHEVMIDAPVELCQQILLDVERYPEWYDTLDEVEVIERDGARRPALVHIVVAAGPLGDVEFDLRMAYTEGIAGTQVAGNGKVVGIHNEWRLERRSADASAALYRFQANAASRRVRLLLRPARALVERGLIRAFPAELKREAERIAGSAKS